MNRPLIGISGTNASGKDTLANHLRDKHGYLFVSGGDILREEAQLRYGNVLRPTLFKVGNELRAEKGPSVLVDMALDKFDAAADDYPGGLVVASIRTTGEADKILSEGGRIVYLDADPRLRYAHMRKRGRLDDNVSYEVFVAQEQAELHQSDDPGKFNILGVKDRADILILNSHDIEEFLSAADKALGFS